MGIADNVINGQQLALTYVATTFANATNYLNKLADAAENAAAVTLGNATPIDDAAIKNKLMSLINGSFNGIPASVEQALWDRARERSNKTMNAAIVETGRRLSAAGWEQPIGDYAEAINQATQAAAFEASDNARQVAVTQANLIVENLRQALQLQIELVKAEASISVEQLRTNLMIAQNKFNYLMEAAKAGAQISAQEMASALSSLSFNSSISSSMSAHTSQSHSISHDGTDGDGPYLILPGF